MDRMTILALRQFSFWQVSSAIVTVWRDSTTVLKVPMRKPMLSNFLVASALVGALLAFAGPLSAAQDMATLKVGQVQFKRCAANTWCATIDRALDPSGVVPGTIPIYFEFTPHSRADLPSKGTLVAVEGGPGYPSSGTRSSYVGLYKPLMDQRDVLLVDNRGTGRSNAVNCATLQTATKPTENNIGACGRSLGAAAPLYSTAYAADDLAAVLDSLAISKIDLYGDSYGTYFSQVFSYRHPDRLRSIVLDSAYPVPMVGGETPWYPFFAPTMRDEFDKVCARSITCSGLSGTSMSHIQPALDLLRASPFDATARDADNNLQRFRADPSMLALVMLAGSPPFTVARELDAAARAFANGDQLPLLRLMAEANVAQDPRISRRNPKPYSEGLFWAVSCQDYAQIYDMRLPLPKRRAQRDAAIAQQERDLPDTYAPFTINEFRNMSLDYSLLDSCVDWPAPPASHPPGPLIPPGASMPNVPVLVLSGEIDTITTPAEGAIVASLYPQGRQVIVANRFHITALPPTPDECGINIARHFIEFLDPGDTSCAARVAPLRTPPVFARTARELPVPLALSGNQASASQLQIAAAAVHTLGDVIARLESNSSGSGPGLRGGSFKATQAGRWFHLDLSRVMWTTDVQVTAQVDWPTKPGQATATLRLKTTDGVIGNLQVQWPEYSANAVAVVTGKVDGKVVNASMPAP
jgi:pimeloyl-ACP methyl ester carboxylesterase